MLLGKTTAGSRTAWTTAVVGPALLGSTATAASVIFMQGTFSPSRIDTPGFANAHVRPLGATDAFGEWPGYTRGESSPDITEDERLFDRRRVAAAVTGDL